MSEITIVIDRAENGCRVPALLQGHPDVVIENCELPGGGDYLVGPGCVIERKERDDFFASIIDRRLFQQAVFLKANYARPIFLIEGDLFSSRHNFDAAAIHGALSYLAVIEGVTVLFSASQQDSAGLIHTMARHCQHGLGYEIPLRADKPRDIRPLMQYVVEGLPGVGAKTAKALLAHFGSVAAVFAASDAELLAVPGMGKRGMEKIREVLVAKWIK